MLFYLNSYSLFYKEEALICVTLGKLILARANEDRSLPRQ